MAQKILPFLSGTLKGIIEDVANKNNPIAQEILHINAIIEDTLKVYSYLPDKLKNAIKEKLIDTELTWEVSMLSCRVGSNDANISFLPKDKEPEYTENGTWARKNRQEGKPAKIFQKALVKQFKQQEWEIFSNAFKAEVCECNNFELVSGEDIRKWYFEDYYYQNTGTLGNSCMRYKSAQDYFDVYVDNAKMLITKRAGKLTGRAIVWEIDENTTVLDRIYTCFDYLENCFIDYAKEHKWIIRNNNSLLHTGEEQLWLTSEDDYASPKHINMKIKLKSRYDMFPYVDSFRYYNDDTNEISTYLEEYTLDSTDGDYCRTCVTCDNCGQRYYGYDDIENVDEIHWSEWGGGYVCDECSYWCEELSDYIPNYVESVRVYTDIAGITFDRIPVQELENRIVSNPSELEDVNSREAIIKTTSGAYYFYTCVSTQLVFNLDTNSYEIRSNSNERD